MSEDLSWESEVLTQTRESEDLVRMWAKDRFHLSSFCLCIDGGCLFLLLLLERRFFATFTVKTAVEELEVSV